MDPKIARALSHLIEFDQLERFETNVRRQGEMTPEIEEALKTRWAEAGRTLIARRTGLILTELSPAEDRIVEAVSKYVGLMKRQGKDAGRTMLQLRNRGLIEAAETAVAKSKPTQGYQVLKDEDLEELSYEQIILDHPDEFSERAAWYARRTLGIANTGEKPPPPGESLTQSRCAAVIAWLRRRPLSQDGTLGGFTNTDAALAIGLPDMSRHGRVFGNIVSRVDFACYRSSLPPLGLTADEAFQNAWSRGQRTWEYPIDAMKDAAQSFIWQGQDFDRILQESRSLPLQAHRSWEKETQENEAAVRAWANALGRSHQSMPGPPEVAKVPPRGNPDWTFDEHILGLDLYLRLRGTAYSDTHPEVIGLSETLRELARVHGRSGGATFRNANGVSMKMMNFRRLDAEYTRDGRVGLPSGNRMEDTIWHDYALNPEDLRLAVASVLASLPKRALEVAPVEAQSEPLLSKDDVQKIQEILDPDNADQLVPSSKDDLAQRIAKLEGQYATSGAKKKTKVSTFIERGSTGDKVKQANGHRCQVCEALGLDPIGFRKKNGGTYVEAHHVQHVSTLGTGVLAPSNIMTVCANHHRQMHYGDVSVTVLDTNFSVDMDGQILLIQKYHDTASDEATVVV